MFPLLDQISYEVSLKTHQWSVVCVDSFGIWNPVQGRYITVIVFVHRPKKDGFNVFHWLFIRLPPIICIGCYVFCRQKKYCFEHCLLVRQKKKKKKKKKKTELLILTMHIFHASIFSVVRVVHILLFFCFFMFFVCVCMYVYVCMVLLQRSVTPWNFPRWWHGDIKLRLS